MNVQTQIQVNNKRKQLEQNRTHKLKKKLTQLNRKKIVQDKNQRHKPSHFLKTKTIAKKQFETIREAVKRPQVILQQNVNANTFIHKSQKYLKCYNRTKQILKLQPEKVQQAYKMIYAFAAQNKKQRNLYLNIEFQKMVNCITRPIQIELPHHYINNHKTIFVTQYGKTKQAEFEQIKHLNIEILSIQQFLSKTKDSKFKKMVLRAGNYIFCDFKIYLRLEKLRIFKEINKRNVIFPIQNGRIPSALKSKFQTYSQYIEDLHNHIYFMTKPQQSFTVSIGSIRDLKFQQMIENLLSATPQIVARILEKNKQKHNRVKSIQLTSQNSIPFQIYKCL